MTEEQDWITVRRVYPEAFCHKEKTYGRTEEFTVFDPRTSQFVGPPAFTEANAWRHAAQRIEKG